MSLLWILQASILHINRRTRSKYLTISLNLDTGNCNASYLLENNFIKHNYSKSHRRKAIGSSKTTPASSVIAQMDASDLNSRSDDNQDTNTNVCDSPNDVRYYDALRDPTLAENVGVVF